jgi:hypothetical protein
MPSYSNEIIECVKIQDALMNLWPNPTRLLSAQEEHPQLAMTLSAQNREGFNVAISNVGGKIRMVEGTYRQRKLKSEVQTNMTHGCDGTGNTATKKHTWEMNIENNIGDEFEFDPEEFVGTCQDDVTYIAETVEISLAAIRDRMAQRLAEDSVAALGKWAANVQNVTADSLIVQAFIDNQTYRPNPSAWIDLDMALKLSGFGLSGIFGDQVLVKAAAAASVGGIASFGINLRDTLEKYGKGVMYDQFVEDALTASGQSSIAQGLGAVQMAFYAKYANPVAVKRDDSSMAYVIQDPVYGYPIDARFHWDCDKLKVKLIVTPQTLTLPDDLFKVGDRMEGVIGLAGITVDNCDVAAPCPTE